MAIEWRWRMGAAVCALALAMSACSEESKPSGDGDGDGDTGDGDGDNGGDGDGDGDGDGSSLLGDGVAGSACSPGTLDCGQRGNCATQIGALAPIATPGGYCTVPCMDDSECGGGGICFGIATQVTGGECRKACTSNADCRESEGYECAMAAGGGAGGLLPSSCQPLPTPVHFGPDDTGKLCTEDTDCAAGGTCSQAGLCTGVCLVNEDCGAGNVCTPGLYGSSGTCQEGCETDADCQNAAMGWGCPSEGEVKLCEQQLPDGIVGKACTEATQDTDCAGGMCRLESMGVAYPDGYCISNCQRDEQCGANGVCIDSTRCLQKCTANTDCRDGYECKTHPFAVTTTDVTVCFPIMPDTDGGAPGAADGGT